MPAALGRSEDKAHEAWLASPRAVGVAVSGR